MARISAVGIALIGLLAAAPAASANPILNGDFEAGLSGWTVDAAGSGSLLIAAAHGAPGNETAWFGATGGHDDSLSQTFATQAGDSYVVGFWLGHGATDNANDFSVWWDATPLVTLQRATKFGQTYFSFITTAIDDSTTLTFSGRERVELLLSGQCQRDGHHPGVSRVDPDAGARDDGAAVLRYRDARRLCPAGA